MTQPGYQEGNERGLWWKVAKHLDEARVAAVNAMAHNVDDSTSILALEDRLREAQAILLEIFRAKGLLPRGKNGEAAGPLPPVWNAVSKLPIAEPPLVDAPVSAAEEAAAYEDAVGDSPPSTETASVVAAPVEL